MFEKPTPKDFTDIDIEGIVAKLPAMGSGPLIKPSADGNHPSKLVITSTESIIEELRRSIIPDRRMARLFSGAINEVLMFRFEEHRPKRGEAETEGKPTENPLARQAIESLQGLLAALSGVNGMALDIFKQIEINVATSTSTDKGMQPLQVPMGKPPERQERYDRNNGSNSKRP